MAQAKRPQRHRGSSSVAILATVAIASVVPTIAAPAPAGEATTHATQPTEVEKYLQMCRVSQAEGIFVQIEEKVLLFVNRTYMGVGNHVSFSQVCDAVQLNGQFEQIHDEIRGALGTGEQHLGHGGHFYPIKGKEA